MIAGGVTGVSCVSLAPHQDAACAVALCHYRNRLLHLFVGEGMVACAYDAVANADTEAGAALIDVATESAFLACLLSREFVGHGAGTVSADAVVSDGRPRRGSVTPAIKQAVAVGTLVHSPQSPAQAPQPAQAAGGRLALAENDASHLRHHMFASMVRPLVDSYWAVVVACATLVGDGTPPVTPPDLAKTAQWIVDRLVAARLALYPEAASLSVLGNAVAKLVVLGVLEPQASATAQGQKARPTGMVAGCKCGVMS